MPKPSYVILTQYKPPICRENRYKNTMYHSVKYMYFLCYFQIADSTMTNVTHHSHVCLCYLQMTVKAENIVIATGMRPVYPNVRTCTVKLA